MEPIYLSIQPQETGKHIKSLLMDNGYTVKDIQEVMGFQNPQAVYKWMAGKSLPSLDNLIILSRLLNTSIEDILVIDEDVVILRKKCFTEKMFYGKNVLCGEIYLAMGSSKFALQIL